MESYTQHRRLASQIRELAETLAAESERFHRAAARKRRPRRVSPAVERSTEWLQHALHALVMAAVALRQADAQLHRPHRSKRKR